VRVLMIHNSYRQRGGEDESVRLETELLRSAGHEVDYYGSSNIDVRNTPLDALRIVWNARTYDEVRSRIRRSRPDVVHVQNFFAAVSPAAHYAAAAADVPVVQTLRNYRILCCNASFFRGGETCNACMNKIVPWRGVRHACYRQSTLMSAVVAASIAFHNGLGTWRDRVNCYIALSESAKAVFTRAGFDASRIVVKPNFLTPVPPARSVSGDHYLYVGRLSKEKGVQTLVKAMALAPAVNLKIVGEGPELRMLKNTVDDLGLSGRVEFMGEQTHQSTVQMIQAAKAVIVPSEWDEPFGRVIIEAYACGVPVIGSRRGAVAELVKHGVTGLQFSPADPIDLADAIARLERDSTFAETAGRAARAEFESRFTAEANLESLLAAYRQAITDRENRSGNVKRNIEVAHASR
jgi:glycosyltransferase involved in cell wall biosynthesis